MAKISYSSFLELMKDDRSIRRFKNDMEIPASMLRDIVSLCRYCASGRNAQPLKYLIIETRDECEKIYPHIKWAGYYKDWDGPDPDERPVAYLLQCLDTSLASDPMADDGLQLQAMTLGARTLGLGACIIKSFNDAEISRIFNLPDHLKPLYVVALGYPGEKPHLVDMQSEDFKYFIDPANGHTVPKRTLDELILKR